MSQTYREVEVKLRVDDLNAVRQRLEATGATLTKPRVFERNIRYDDGALVSHGRVLRLRQDDRARLTFKTPADPDAATRGISSRFEAEVTVDDFDTMHRILIELGYLQHMTYEKHRTTYTLDGGEIVLDEMPYGNFVEIEGDETTIERLIQTLNLTDAPRLTRSYSQLFDHVRANLGLTMTDLTFDAFAGIDVPATAFDIPTDEVES